MRFKILGPLEVEDSGRLIDAGSPKQRAVLALLLVDANRVVSLDRLIDQLWGGEPPPRATGSLQAYIANLRRALEPGRAPRTPPRVLLTQPPGYVLRVDPEDLDAAQFESTASEGRGLLAEGRPAAARAALVRALDLWRGPALADFVFETFARTEAHRLEELRLVALEDRLEAELALGDHATAVAALERLVAEEPLRERAWALLMLALYRSGRQAEALRAFQHARRTLAEELGIDPSPALSRLEHDILSHSPALEWRPPAAEEPVAVPVREPAPPVAPPAPTAPSADGAHRLVGREEQLHRLDSALASALAGRGRFVLVAGEAGIGKTRLLEAVADRVANAGVEVGWGRCHEGEGAPPFWPWVQVARVLADSRPSELIAALGPAAPEVAAALPDLRELLPEVTPRPTPDADAARFRLYDATTRALVRLAAERPLAIVLDDLHWADAASLQLLEFLAAHVASSRLLVLATYRPVEVTDDHPLAQALATVARQAGVERLDLTGLDEEHVAQFIASAAGIEPDGALAAAVHRRTDGNPFFVTELVRLLVSEGRLTGAIAGAAAAAVERGRVPAGVRDVLRRRLARLPEQTTALLAVAAVMGREFDLDVLEAAAGLGEEALDRLEPAIIAGLVVTAPQGFGRLRFSHALVRETVYDELTPIRRARLHRRVGEALEPVAATGEDRTAELAHHFFRAAAVDGPDRAVLWAERAAEAAMDRLACEQAEEHLRRGVDLLQSAAPGPERDRRELSALLRLSTVQRMTRGYAAPGIDETAERIRALCLRLGEHASMVPALWAAWAFSCVGAQFRRADAVGRELLEIGTQTGDDVTLAAGHWAVGVVALHEGRLVDARDHLAEVTRLGDLVADRPLIEVFTHDPAVAARCFAMIAAWLLGEEERCATLLAELDEATNRLRHPFNVVVSAFFQAWLAALRDDASATLATVERAVALCNEGGFRLYGAMGTMLRGWAWAEQVDVEVGLAELREGLAAFERTGARMLQPFCLSLLARALRRARRDADALATVEDALARVERLGERFWEPELHRLRAELLLAVAPQRAAEAERSLSLALDVAERQHQVPLRRRAEATAGALALRSVTPTAAPSAG